VGLGLSGEVVRSDGRRYDVPLIGGISISAVRGVFSPDHAEAVVPSPAVVPPRTSWRHLRIVDLSNGSSRAVSTEPLTAPPVFGPHGDIAYASGTTVHFLDGRTIRARDLPKGAKIIILELAPKDGVVAALVTWNWQGKDPNPSEALYVISPRQTRRVVGGLEALSEQPDPVWSPNGDRIAFSRVVRGRGTVVYVVRSDGSDLREISQGRRGSGPIWSPDGKQLAYTQSNGHDEVYISDLNGHERRLTHIQVKPGWIDMGDDPFPGTDAGAWSPDGRYIAVVTANRLGVVNAESGEERLLGVEVGPTDGPVGWPHASR
jgi:WD40 repeat protein